MSQNSTALAWATVSESVYRNLTLKKITKNDVSKNLTCVLTSKRKQYMRHSVFKLLIGLVSGKRKMKIIPNRLHKYKELILSIEEIHNPYYFSPHMSLVNQTKPEL